MKNYKKIISAVLIGSMTVLTACNLGNSGQITDVPTTKSEILTSEVKPEPSETAPIVSSESDSEQDVTTQQKVVLPDMGADYHAELDGKIYYREYGKDDFSDSIILYFSDPFEPAMGYAGEHRIMCMTEDGRTEVAFEGDKGFGPIYAAGGKLFLQERESEGDFVYDLYCINPDGTDKTCLEGYCNMIDCVGDYIFCKIKSGESYFSYKFAILDAKTLSEVAVVDGEYLGADESGVYSYVRTDNQGGLMNNLYLTFFKTDYNGSTKVAGEVTPEFFSGDADYQLEYEEYSILEVPCFQILKDCIVFNVGYYQGTGHFYTGGIIGYIMKNETSPYYCTKTSWENFYATETDEGIAVFHNGIEGMEKTAIAGVGADAVDYESEKKAVPYVYSESKIASYGKRYDVGDVVIYADDSGELTTLLKASEYEEFGYTTKNNDYENGPVTEIYNIEYTGDKLFFSIAKMEHMPENDIGWRIAYRHSQTADFVKNMTTGKIDMLGEYGPDVE